MPVGCDWWLPVHPCRRLPSKCSAKNALFLPTKADYRVIPWATFTDPELVLLGAEPRSYEGMILYVVKQDFAGGSRPSRSRNQRICQNHYATEWSDSWRSSGWTSAGEFNSIVLAMSHKLKISALSGIHIYPTLAEVNSKAAFALTKQKYEKTTNFRAC